MIKKILKAIDVAFSMYSKIPMPRFNWASEDMKYHLCFFPWVGIVIGVLELGVVYLSGYFNLGTIFQVAMFIAVPLLVTGGFHLDGFMDTMDAIHSYQPKEKKLEILKDPHIGAFSVISLVVYLLIAVAFLSKLCYRGEFYILALSFVMSRALSGLSLMYLKNAKDSGMLNTSTVTADKKIVRVVLWVELVLVAGVMLLLDYKYGALAITGFGIAYLYYYKMSYKNFGGITGDLAGFFVCISELIAAIFVAIGGLFL